MTWVPRVAGHENWWCVVEDHFASLVMRVAGKCVEEREKVRERWREEEEGCEGAFWFLTRRIDRGVAFVSMNMREKEKSITVQHHCV